jgi:hypothetical protein
MLQRMEDRVALVAGAALGMGGGALGAFLVCTAGRAVACRLLNQWEDQYLDLSEPAASAPRHCAQPTPPPGEAMETHPVTDQDRDRTPRMVPILSGD